MTDVMSITVQDSVEQAVRRLVSARHFHAGSIVSMPVMYPSGSSVTLEITMQDGRAFVSDMGSAHNEAEMLGAMRYFRSEANRIAEVSSIKFDGRDMFIAEVAIDNLHGAMTVVANASSTSVAAAALKLAERNDKDAADELYHRLSSIYRSNDVQKDAQVLGASSHKWRVSVLVLNDHSPWMFEPVSNHYVNIVSTAAKFHDFARLEVPPARVSVIKSRSDLGDYYELISGASTKVIPMTEPDSAFVQLLAVA